MMTILYVDLCMSFEDISYYYHNQYDPRLYRYIYSHNVTLQIIV